MTAILGWSMVDPTNTAWLMNDPAQHVLSWSFFRDEPWEFPLTYTHRYGYPLGTAISLSDAIPVVAVPLKVISAWLPHPFQYLGLFCVLSMALNYWFGMLLVRQIGHGRLLSHLAGILFLISPVVLWRLHGHTALTAHWLVLAGLYFYLRPLDPERIWRWLAPFPALAALAAGIHPFFVPIMMMIALAAAIRAGLGDRRLWLAGILMLGLAITLVLAELVVLGTVSIGGMSGLVERGYRTFSMNLLGLVDPQGWGGLLYGALPTAVAYPGYAYLGLGVIVLLALAVPGYRAAWRSTPASVLWPLIGVAHVSFALAVSARVTLGPWVLADVPLPEAIEALMGVFRTSERFVWPAYYLIMLAAFAGLLWAPRPLAALLVAVVIVAQVADVLPIMRTAGAAVNRVRTEPTAVTTLRNEVAGLKHLAVLPMWRCNQHETPTGISNHSTLGFVALELGMTTNNYNASRMTAAGTKYHCEDAPAAFQAGQLEPDTAYFVSGKLAAGLPPDVRQRFCKPIEEFDLCVVRE